jgi:hypothetical protein
MTYINKVKSIFTKRNNRHIIFYHDNQHKQRTKTPPTLQKNTKHELKTIFTLKHSTSTHQHHTPHLYHTIPKHLQSFQKQFNNPLNSGKEENTQNLFHRWKNSMWQR